jgi:acyl-CoA synthetase (AMP-forming)/AMP-acid ligase II
LFNRVLNQPWFRANPPKSLRLSLAGGMALQEAVAVRWRKITGTEVVEGYGLTESSPVPVGARILHVESSPAVSKHGIVNSKLRKRLVIRKKTGMHPLK